MNKGEQKLMQELDFSKILFLQINRIMQTSIMNSEAYISAVDSLEDILTPYLDDDYTHNIEKFESAFKKNITNIDPMVRQDILIDSERVAKARKKLRALMILAESKGLLLEKIGYGYGEDDEDDTEF